MTNFEVGALHQSWAWPTGTTKILAVVGDPIDHSLSPILHNAALKSLGLDMVYVALRVPKEDIALAIASIRTFGLAGCSVTMPHKERVIPYLDGLSDRAQALQSVNVVYRDANDRLIGDSNDGVALVHSLRDDHSIGVRGKTVAILGSGGAGRAISLAIADAGAQAIYIVSRNLETAARAADLARDAGYVGELSDVIEADIVINATPIGMAGTSMAGLSPLTPERLREGQFVYDIIYHPTVTPLIDMASTLGIATGGGIGMLVRLAAMAFTTWTGFEAPIEEMQAAAKAETLRRL